MHSRKNHTHMAGAACVTALLIIHVTHEGPLGPGRGVARRCIEESHTQSLYIVQEQESGVLIELAVIVLIQL